MREIIDCHCHIYPDKIAERAAHAIGEFYHIPMCCDGKIATMRQEGEKAGITKFLVFSVATKPQQTSSINHYIAQTVAESDGKMRGLGTMHPDNENPVLDVEEIVTLGLCGVKLHPDIQSVAIDDPRCMRIFEECEGRLPVLLHTGDSRYDYSNPNRLIPVLKKFPRLTVIGAHFGGWSIWSDAAEQLHGYENFYVDCSSSLTFLAPEEARRIIRLYGADRVLFGTDYPMWHPQAEVAMFDALALSEEESRAILSENAKRLFGF